MAVCGWLGGSGGGDDEGRFGTAATTVCVRATCVGCAFLIAAAAFIIIIIIIIIIIQVHNVCECSARVCVLERRGTVALTQYNIILYI